MVEYGRGGLVKEVKNITGIVANEVELFQISSNSQDSNHLEQMIARTQITMYYNVTLGSLTGIKFRYYFWSGMLDGSGNKIWQPLPIKNLSTGELVDTPSEITVNTYTPDAGTTRQAIDAIPAQACLGFRITATGVGTVTTPGTINALRVMTRNN